MDIRATYSPRTDVDWDQLKKDTLKYVCGNYDYGREETENDIQEEFIPLWNALKSVDFDLNMFFSRKLYEDVPEDGLSGYITTVCLFYANPISVYLTDWFNGYLDFDYVDPDISAGADWHPKDEIEKLEYMWYCKKDEDIWWMLGQGIGNIKDMYDWYMGEKTTPPDLYYDQIPPCYFIKDEKKALKMILFLELNLAESNKAVALTTRMLYNNTEGRKKIWQLLMPELIEDAWKCLAENFDLSATQIYNVVLRFTTTMDELPAGWGMDLFSKMNILDEFCYVEQTNYE